VKSKSDQRGRGRRGAIAGKSTAGANRARPAGLGQSTVAAAREGRKPAVTAPGKTKAGKANAKPRTTSDTMRLQRAEARALAVAPGEETAVVGVRRGKRARARKAAVRTAKFGVGQVVRHKHYPFRGVVFDIDPVFASTEEWWLSIPAEVRPKKNQPFYHLLAENDETEYIAYVSEQNLLADESGHPIRHPQLTEFFVDNGDGTYRAVFMSRH
jgi:heat shock protein HspQ